jgi:hypothetical protein
MMGDLDDRAVGVKDWITITGGQLWLFSVITPTFNNPL